MSALAEFNGKVVLITGGARGIGRSTAIDLASRGASVALFDVEAAGMADALGAMGDARGRSEAFRVDVTSRPEVEAGITAVIERFGRIDVLVNNAAIVRRAPFLELTDAQWNETLGVNLTGYFIVAQEVARRMVAQGAGRIINVASFNARIGMDWQSAYSAAKGGVLALTRVMAFELAPSGILVNAVLPGAIMTDMAIHSLSPIARTAREQRVPQGRFGTPSEVAAVISFLASSAASYITGTEMVVDGGLLVAGIREQRPQAAAGHR